MSYYRYNNNYFEKSFLYLLALSFLLHTVLFVFLTYIPQEKKKIAYEPIMVDLQDLPSIKESPSKEEKEVKRFAEERHRVARETAPKGERERDRLAPPQIQRAPSIAQQHGGRNLSPRFTERGKPPAFPSQPSESPLKPREERVPGLSQLYPSAGKLARLEENYRKKFGEEVEEGETRFLNTNDIQFGSFLRRFETAVYGVWTYPEDAARLGIEGVTPVKITFNRKGEIEKVSIIESSGSTMLDNEVLRTLSMIGPIGPFPKGYNKDKFNLVAFFQYGIVRGLSRGMLH